MGKTDGREENRQQLHKSEADRILEKSGRTEKGRKLRTALSLLIVLMFTVTATCVQALELGGFDVDMGTGSFEEENSGWDQDSGETADTDSENDNNANDSWNNKENTWNDTMDSNVESSAQTVNDWEDSFSTGQYEDDDLNSSYSSNLKENQMSEEEAGDAGNTVNTTLSSESPEEQISEKESFWGLSSTPTTRPTAMPSLSPARSISSTPVPKPTGNILALPEKEELPDEECRQKMQLIYCKKEIQKVSKIKICPNFQLAAAVLSVRVNGKEAEWKSVGGDIFLNMNEEQEHVKIETVVMCSRELSWTETKKNAILTYTIF